MKAKPDRPPPGVVKLGAGAHYTRLDVLADTICITEAGLRTLLSALDGIPIVHFPSHGDARYILTYAFESALFNLGMPVKIKEKPDLMRVHQELAGVLYGSLTKEALRDRVKMLIKSLTSAGDEATIGRRKRPKESYKSWSGRKPSG